MRSNLTRRLVLAAAACAAATPMLAGCGGSGNSAATPAPAPAPPPAAAPPAASAPPPASPVATPLPLGNRTLSIAAIGPQDTDFGPNVIQRLVAAGATSTSLSVYWDEIERSPGVYNPAPNFLAVGNAFYPPSGIKLALGFSVIDTNNRRLPADLAGRALDDPLVISRFRAMLNWAATQVPNATLSSLVIGNEVDVYLGANPQQWQPWRNFLQAAIAHARTLWPTTPIGCKATLNGLTNEPTRTELIAMNALCDELHATWYAIANDFSVLPAAEVLKAFDKLVALPANLPIRLLELGSPSDSLIGGTQANQADFISACFAAWDRHAGRIVQLEFFALHDFDPALVVTLQTYYGLSSPRFAAYLGSLGLRSFAGKGVDKLAWQRLLTEQAARKG